MKIQAIFLHFLLLLLPIICLTQNPKADSLKLVIPTLQEDTSKVDALLDLSANIFRTQPDSAIIYANQAKTLAEQINYPKGLGYALKNIGLAYYVKSDFVEVLNYWEQSLAKFRAIDDKLGMSNLNSNIGVVHMNYGNDLKALEYFLESLQAAEQLGDKLRIATALMNIGAVYNNKKSTYDKAMEAYQKAIPISEEVGDLAAIGTAAVNLGELYHGIGNYELALVNFQKALKALEASGGNTSYVLSSIGTTYVAQGDFEKGIEYHKKAVKSATEKNSDFQKAQALNRLGLSYQKKGDYRAAIDAFFESIKNAQNVGSDGELKIAYKGLADSFSKLRDYKNAFDYQKLFNEIQDTIYSQESDQKMANLEFQFDLEKKEVEIELLKKDKELDQSTIERAHIFRNFLFAVAGLLLIIMVGIYYQYRFAKKSNKIISKERNRAEKILLNILPTETAEELKEKGFVEAKRFQLATVLFTDFTEFTKFAESHSPEVLVKNIDFYFTKFDEIISRHHLEKIKTIGDSYMCAGGLPNPNNSNPKDAIKAAIEIVNFVNTTKINPPEGVLPFNIRIGINSGPVVAGVVGTKKFQYDIWGTTVNIAARMESSSSVGKINISENTFQLVNDEFDCEFRGEIEAKNGEKLKMYFVKQPATVQI